MIHTNYSINDWKRLAIYAVVYLSLSVSSIVIFAGVVLFPGMNIWNDAFPAYGDVFFEVIATQELSILDVLVHMLNVTAAPLVLMFVSVIVFSYSFRSAQWITKKLKLTPVMALVIFVRSKKLCQFNF